MTPRFNRRAFLQGSAAGAAGLSAAAAAQAGVLPSLVPPAQAATEGHVHLADFEAQGTQWRVYEDQSRRDGVITFV
ncbi:MAG: hypothetical protein QM667_10575, partial [Asticcacaulis sp.]